MKFAKLGAANPFFIKFQGQDKMYILNAKIHISSPNPIFDHLLESSRRDDSKQVVKHRIRYRIP